MGAVALPVAWVVRDRESVSVDIAKSDGDEVLDINQV